jgi:hypothetical protein
MVQPKKYSFSSKKSENYIILYMDEMASIWVEAYYVDQAGDSENLIHESLDDFHKLVDVAFAAAKKDGGEMHYQCVQMNEWKEFLSDDERWEVIKINDNEQLVYIACDINDAPNCILDAFHKK